MVFPKDQQYEIRIIPNNRNSNLKPIACGGETIAGIKSLNLHIHNEHYNNIYFRPQSYNYVLLDLDHNKINLANKEIRQSSLIMKYKPLLIIQSSKGKYQVWYDVPSITNWTQYKNIAKNLAIKFYGDIKATSSRMVRRLPYYYNNKYEPPQLVKCLYKCKQHSNLPQGILNNIPQQQAPLHPVIPVYTGTDIPKTSFLADMADWGFMNMVYERNPALNKNDLVNILKTQTKYKNNNRYIEKTIDNLIKYRRKLKF
jgi:hypothetical protein